MVRRVQWNFLRLENEHIGNADQYRVTREIPLPYTIEDRDDDSDDDNDEAASKRVKRRPTWRRRKNSDVQLPRPSVEEGGRRSHAGRVE